MSGEADLCIAPQRPTPRRSKTWKPSKAVRRLISGSCCTLIHWRLVCLSGIAGMPSTVSEPNQVANTVAVRLGADLAAAAPYYGAPPMAADVPKIKAAMLVHHGALDTRLAATWPDFDKQLAAAGVPHEGHIWPNAVHGFNNDATPERYNKAAAEEAWNLTVNWFNKYLKA